MTNSHVVVNGRRKKGLRAERQVEYATGLVGKHQPDRDEREDASIWDAFNDVSEEVGHVERKSASGPLLELLEGWLVREIGTLLMA